MKVQNKVILVTGGGNGMGRELVLNLLSKGARVIAIDINRSALQETIELAGTHKEDLATFIVDVTNKKSVEDFRDKAIAQYGVVDGIINNAGIIQPFVKLNDLGYETIERVININLYGTLFITKTFLPHLLTRPEAHIVNVSSMGGFLPVPGQSIYCATKAAVKLITESLYSELANTNVRVTVVFPGAVKTNIMVNSGLENPTDPKAIEASNKILTPEKAAQIIIKGVEENRYRILVGKDSKFMDLIYWVNPRFATKFIGKMMKSRLP
jgi:short-subunit dehydrogenase